MVVSVRLILSYKIADNADSQLFVIPK